MALCEPTVHRPYLTDSTSFSFVRLGPAAHRPVVRGLLPRTRSVIRRRTTTSAGNRPRPPRGGPHERLTQRPSSRYYPAPRRPARQGPSDSHSAWTTKLGQARAMYDRGPLTLGKGKELLAKALAEGFLTVLPRRERTGSAANPITKLFPAATLSSGRLAARGFFGLCCM